MVARTAVLATLLLVALLASTVIAPSLRIAGFRPEPAILVVVAVALADGSGAGMRFGFAAGLTTDLVSGVDAIVGLTALVLLLVGYGSGLARPYTSAAPLAGKMVVAATASAVAVLAIGVLGRLLGTTALPLSRVLVGALAVALWNGLLSPLVLPVVRALLERFPGTLQAPRV